MLKKWTHRVFVAVGFLALVSGLFYMYAYTAMGATTSNLRSDAIGASPQWRDGKFRNVLTRSNIEPGVLWDFFFSDEAQREPESYPEIINLTGKEFATPPESGLRVTWLGHSTLLIEIDGITLLIDPVWAERASPFTFMGPKRFHAPPLALDKLPKIDAVLISHDHYDHLDHETIEALGDSIPLYIVPLGIGAHLEYWGVSADHIVERDWWQEFKLGEVILAATPARHFSGRSMLDSDQDKTLWSGWAAVGPKHRVYYSGDTAMFPEFTEIGDRYGPFDMTMIETGAYNQAWSDVHLGPEQALDAHKMVRGGLYMPVHWGTFDLALHSWTEPVERILAAAEKNGIAVAVPRPGQSIEPASPPAIARWWPEIGWKTADDAPVVSTGLSARQ